MVSFSRRRLAQMLGASLLPIGGVIAVVRSTGYELPLVRRGRLVVLSASEFSVLDAVARRMCAAPAELVAPSVDDVDVVGFIDRFVATMNETIRTDLFRFLSVLEQLCPLLIGSVTRFSKLDPQSQDSVLAKLEAHDDGLLRGAFSGLKALIFMGYYRDPLTWPLLRYDGPTIARAAGGP